MTYELSKTFFFGAPGIPGATLQEREAEIFRQAPDAEKLKEALLKIGGKLVCWHVREPHLDKLLETGRKFSAQTTIMRKGGQPNACHENTARLFLTSKIKPVTGYALIEDRWVQHSWGWDVRKKLVVETTMCRKAYFGTMLQGVDALLFAIGNTDVDFVEFLKETSSLNRARLVKIVERAKDEIRDRS